jgi:hypothetical protein
LNAKKNNKTKKKNERSKNNILYLLMIKDVYIYDDYYIIYLHFLYLPKSNLFSYFLILRFCSPFYFNYILCAFEIYFFFFFIYYYKNDESENDIIITNNSNINMKNVTKKNRSY